MEDFHTCGSFLHLCVIKLKIPYLHFDLPYDIRKDGIVTYISNSLRLTDLIPQSSIKNWFVHTDFLSQQFFKNNLLITKASSMCKIRIVSITNFHVLITQFQQLPVGGQSCLIYTGTPQLVCNLFRKDRGKPCTPERRDMHIEFLQTILIGSYTFWSLFMDLPGI